MKRGLTVLAVFVLLASWPLKADVAPFAAWRLTANDAIARALQAGPAVYVSGRFTKLGRAVAPFTAILDPATLALTVGSGCGSGAFISSGYVRASDGLSDGDGPYVVPPGTAIVRITNDCRFDRRFRVVLPNGVFADDVYDRVVETGGRIYFEASYGAFTPAFVRLIIEADLRTGALLRYWPVLSAYPVHLEGAVPDGRLVASSRRATGEPTVGWFDPTSGTYLEVRTLSRDIRRSYVGRVVVLAVLGSIGDQVLALDATTLAPLPQWPTVEASFTSVTSGGGRVFVGGNHVSVNGVAASQLLAFDTDTGARDMAWSAPPWVDDPHTSFRTLFASGSRLIAFGDMAPGAPRDALAAFDAATGALDPWTPTEVPTFAALVDGRLLLSGISARDRVGRAGIAAIDPETGAVLPWNPTGATTSGSVLAVDPGGGHLYSSGGNGVRRWHLATGSADATWQLDVQAPGGTPGQVTDIALLDGTVYVVGMFTSGRDGATAALQPREAALSITAGGTLTPWRPRLLETCVRFVRTPVSVPCVTRVLAAEGRIVLSGFLQSLDSRWTPNRSALAFTANTADLDPLVPVAPLGTVGALTADPTGLYATVALSRPSLAVMGSQFGVRVIGPIASPDALLPAAIAYHDGRVYARVEQDASAGQPTGNPYVWGGPISVEGGVLDLSGTQMAWHADIAPVAPRPPANLTMSLDGALATLRWEPGAGDLKPLMVPAPAGGTAATTHIVLARTTPGGAPVAQVDTGSANTSFSMAAPAGTFYVRVQARNAFGTSAPSAEIRVDVQPQPPEPPAATVASVQGRIARIEWQAMPRGWPATGYVLDAGTAPGLTNVGSLLVSGTSFQATVPPGRYYVRVRAVNAIGASAPGDEVIVDVP